MPPVLFIMISVVVAACIGGVTNYIAIRMLFRPRTAIFIGRWRLPFTPGLFPKRKKDIARSLGHVVATYLVTPESISTLLMKPHFKHTVEARLRRSLERWLDSDRTLFDIVSPLWTREQSEAVCVQVAKWLRRFAAMGMEWAWERREQWQVTLGALIPGWGEEKKEQCAALLADWLRTELDKMIVSPEGTALLRQLLRRAIEQAAGGMLGAFASMFINEDKIITKVQASLLQKLSAKDPDTAQLLTRLVKRKLDEWEHLKLVDLVEWIVSGFSSESTSESTSRSSISRHSDSDFSAAESSVPQSFIHLLDQHLHWEKWLVQAGVLPLKQMVNARMKRWLYEKAPTFIDVGLRLLALNVKQIVGAIELPKLVEEQISRFPVERFEQLLLDVTGRELRAITWLGALLGGMIGLFQAILLKWNF